MLFSHWWIILYDYSTISPSSSSSGSSKPRRRAVCRVRYERFRASPRRPRRTTRTGVTAVVPRGRLPAFRLSFFGLVDVSRDIDNVRRRRDRATGVVFMGDGVGDCNTFLLKSFVIGNEYIGLSNKSIYISKSDNFGIGGIGGIGV